MNTDNNSSKLKVFTDRIIENYLKIPHLPDPKQYRVAETLHTLSTIILLIGIATLAIAPFVFSNIVRGMAITGSSLVFILLVQYLNRKGKVNLAAHIFVYSIWIIDTVIIVLSNGFYSPFLSEYITITVMGGLILGGMAAYHFAGISIISMLLLFFLNSQGLMPYPIIIFTPVASIIISIVAILLAAITLIMVIIKYEENSNELIEKEQSLSQTNQELIWEIQAREEAETLKKQSDDQLKSALMDSPYPTMLHADNGEIIIVNTAWVENCGYSPRQLRSIDQWLNICFRENATQVAEEIDKLIQSTQKQREGIYTLYREDGSTLSWVLRWTQLPKLTDGRNLVLTIASDITNLKYVESALRESEENLSKFSLLTNDGIWDWDLQNDTVHFDPLYYTMAGYGVDEFPHHLEEFRKRIHPDDVEKVFGNAEDHLNGLIEQFSIEFRFLRKDGSWLWVMGRGKITEQDENGNPLRFVGTHTDISSQKAVEEELSHYQLQLEDIVEDRTQRLNERISEVERLNAALTNILDDYQTANEKLSFMSSNLTNTYKELESFTYSVSNDLRIPLNGVKESSQILLKKYPSKIDEKALEHIESVRDNALLMDNLIENLTKLSLLGRQTINPISVDPSALVEEIFNTFSDQIKKRKIKIAIKELPHCRADEALLKMALHNLISNAVKFTENQKNPEITIGYQPDQSSKRVIYYIKDNGVGFNMDDKEKIFENFQRLHSQDQFQGSGIGLAIAKKIINRHGGEIWVEAAEKEGAAFYFDLERLDK